MAKKDFVFTLKCFRNGGGEDWRDSLYGTAEIGNGAASFHWVSLGLKKPTPRLDFEIACMYHDAANLVATGPYVSSGNPSPPYGLDNVRNILGVSARLKGPDSSKFLISYHVYINDGTSWIGSEGNWAFNPNGPPGAPGWITRMTVSISPTDPYNTKRNVSPRTSKVKRGSTVSAKSRRKGNKK